MAEKENIKGSPEQEKAPEQEKKVERSEQLVDDMATVVERLTRSRTDTGIDIPMSASRLRDGISGVGGSRITKAIEALKEEGRIERKRISKPYKRVGWVLVSEAFTPERPPKTAEAEPVVEQAEKSADQKVDDYLDEKQEQINNALDVLPAADFRAKFLSGSEDDPVLTADRARNAIGVAEKPAEFQGFSDDDLRFIVEELNDFREQVAEITNANQEAARLKQAREAAGLEAATEVAAEEAFAEERKAFLALDEDGRDKAIGSLGTEIQKLKRRLKKKKRGSNEHKDLLQQVRELSALLKWMNPPDQTEQTQKVEEPDPIEPEPIEPEPVEKPAVKPVEVREKQEIDLQWIDKLPEEIRERLREYAQADSKGRKEIRKKYFNFQDLIKKGIAGEENWRTKDLSKEEMEQQLSIVQQALRAMGRIKDEERTASDAAKDEQMRRSFLALNEAGRAQEIQSLQDTIEELKKKRGELRRKSKARDKVHERVVAAGNLLRWMKEQGVSQEPVEGENKMDVITEQLAAYRRILSDPAATQEARDNTLEMIERYLQEDRQLLADKDRQAQSGFTPEEIRYRADGYRALINEFETVPVERKSVEPSSSREPAEPVPADQEPQTAEEEPEILDTDETEENPDIELEDTGWQEGIREDYASRLKVLESASLQDLKEALDVEKRLLNTRGNSLHQIPADDPRYPRAEFLLEMSRDHVDDLEDIIERKEQGEENGQLGGIEDETDFETWTRQQSEALDVDLERLGKEGVTHEELEDRLSQALERAEAQDRVLADPGIIGQRRAQFEFLRAESDRRLAGIRALEDRLEAQGVAKEESDAERLRRAVEEARENIDALLRKGSLDEEAFEDATEQATWFEWIKSTRMWKREIEGQVLPEEVEGDEGLAKSVPGFVARGAGALAMGLASAAASRFGAKFLPDLIRYGSQSYYSSYEREELKELAEKSGEDFRERVEASKYLTKEKRERFLSIFDKINAKYDSELAEANLSEEERQNIEEERETVFGRLNQINLNMESVVDGSSEQRNREVAELIDNMIETRVKGATVLKEGVNTAIFGTSFVFAGAAAFRAPAYAALAMLERYQRVARERSLSEIEGKELESLAHDYIYEGLVETYENLRGREGETKLTRMMNIAKASGNILRVAGLSYGIDKYWTKWGFAEGVDRELLGPAKESFRETMDWALDKLAGHDTSIFSSEIVADSPEVEAAGNEVRGHVAEAAKSSAAEGGAVEEILYPERVEITPEDLKLATVHKGDGFVSVIERQFYAHPEYGYDGNLEDTAARAAWAKHAAIDYANSENVIFGQHELRLNEASKDALAIVLKEDGMHFVDTADGHMIGRDQLSGYTYVYDNGIQTNPIENEIPKPPRVLAEEALTNAELANRTEEIVPGIDFATSANGLETSYRLEHASLRFSFDDDGRLVSAHIDNAHPPRQLSDEVLKTLSGGEMSAADKERYARQIATQIYVLDELDRAGKKGSEEYNAVLESLQGLMAMKSGDVSPDLTDGVYKDYMHGVDIPDRSALEDINEEFAAQKTRGQMNGHARKNVVTDKEWQDMQAAAESLVSKVDQFGNLQVPPYGSVHFDYDGEGNVTGWDKSMKFGVFARLEAAGIVSPGVGHVYDESQTTLSREVITTSSGATRGGRLIVDRTRLPQPHLLKLRKQYSLEVLAVAEASEALEDAGYSASSPERQFLHREMYNLIQRLEQQSNGWLRLTPTNSKFRKYLQSV